MANYINDPAQDPQSRKQGLVSALAGNTGINGKATTAEEPMRLEMGGQPGASPLAAAAAPAATAAPAPAAASPFKFSRDSVSSLLGGYDHTPAGLQKAFAEHPELAGVSKIGGSKGDKILDPSTGRMIDVIQAAGEGGKAWQWLDDSGTPQAGGAMMPHPMFAGSGMAPALQGDAQANIQAALGQFGQAGDSSLIQQLIAKLQGGQ